jgi:hypothetical protein
MLPDFANPDTERTVKLSKNDVRAARRLLQLLLGEEGQAKRPLAIDPLTKPADDITRSAMVARAREEFGNRRRRVAVFGPSMFGEAAWDMLLALYIVDVAGQRQTIGNLMQLAGTPTTTAKRWLDFLMSHDLVRRDFHPTDRRTSFISLTPKAREKLDLYYSETSATGM